MPLVSFTPISIEPWAPISVAPSLVAAVQHGVAHLVEASGLLQVLDQLNRFAEVPPVLLHVANGCLQLCIVATVAHVVDSGNFGRFQRLFLIEIVGFVPRSIAPRVVVRVPHIIVCSASST